MVYPPTSKRRFTGLTIEVVDSSNSSFDHDDVSVLSNVSDPDALDDIQEEHDWDKMNSDNVVDMSNNNNVTNQSNRNKKEEISVNDQKTDKQPDFASKLCTKTALNESERQPPSKTPLRGGNLQLRFKARIRPLPTFQAPELGDGLQVPSTSLAPATTPDAISLLRSKRMVSEKDPGNAWDDLLSTWQTLKRPSPDADTVLKQQPQPVSFSSSSSFKRRMLQSSARFQTRWFLFGDPYRLPQQPQPQQSSTHQTSIPAERGQLWQDLVSQWSTLRT